MNPVYPRSAPINRVVHPTPHLLATGDDDGTIKVSVLISCYPPRGEKIQNAILGNVKFEAMGPTEAGRYLHVYAAL